MTLFVVPTDGGAPRFIQVRVSAFNAEQTFDH